MTETMTAAQARALREPFPASAIGKLPKPYRADSLKGNCDDCGGYHGLPAVHLDYVGHAATTARLLAVDPLWTWEPMATDEKGLPALDSKNNLWIRLTVCGVTRIGVGDGKSAKECIGDAIRNAAMRFGVALDLWAKEDLAEIELAQNESEPEKKAERTKKPLDEPDPWRTEPPASVVSSTAPESPLLNTKSKLAISMYAGIAEAGIPEPERIDWLCRVLGRDIESTKQMTDAEAQEVLRVLAERKAATKEPADA